MVDFQDQENEVWQNLDRLQSKNRVYGTVVRDNVTIYCSTKEDYEREMRIKLVEGITDYFNAHRKRMWEKVYKQDKHYHQIEEMVKKITGKTDLEVKRHVYIPLGGEFWYKHTEFYDPATKNIIPLEPLPYSAKRPELGDFESEKVGFEEIPPIIFNLRPMFIDRDGYPIEPTSRHEIENLKSLSPK